MKRFNKFKKVNKGLYVALAIIVSISTGLAYNTFTNNQIHKAELAYSEYSPQGKSGGSVIPASCDSYPQHSTCQCTIGQTQACAYPNGVGTQTCVASGDNLLWDNACSLVSCNSGYDKFNNNISDSCIPSCTGSNARTFTTYEKPIGCNPVCSGNNCVLNKEEDKTKFAKYLGIESASAITCIDPIYVTVKIPSCGPCPSGQVPNADHTSCIAPANINTPSVDIHFQ